MTDQAGKLFSNTSSNMPKMYVIIGVLVVGLAGIYCLVSGTCSILTSDQGGYRLYRQERYQDAAERFTTPMWRGAALFRAGEFKQAAGIYAGYDTAEAAYNHGTSLVMLGKYEDAIVRYERALELRPGWEDAQVNLEIARARAEKLKKEGGDMTGGQMGADDIVFTKGKPSPEAGDDEIEAGQALGDAEMRTVWLRNVQTKPADFLRAKFAYQQTAATANPSP